MCRSTPAEAFEGERLGKRVRKKKKMFMESGDEEEDNIEEEEVTHTHLTEKSIYSTGMNYCIDQCFFFSLFSGEG